MLFVLAFVVMVYGVIHGKTSGVGIPTLWWWFPKMTASFLLFASPDRPGRPAELKKD